MSEQLSVFVGLDDGAEGSVAELVGAIRGLDTVADVDVQIEEPERSAAEVLQSVTLTVTAVSGLLASATLLIDQIQALLGRIRGVRSAQVETAEGLRELPLEGAPRNENPAQ